jgi:simple sugar transport system permease protein
VLLAAALLAAIGVAPGTAATTFWQGTFGTPANLGTTLTQALPLCLVAMGWIISTRAGRLHVGFPGQIIAGGTVATVAGLQCGALPAPLAVLVTAIAGIVGGAIWAALTAWFWASRGVLEIVSSLLLNLVAEQIAAWLVRGPLNGTTDGQPQSANFPPSTLWPTVESLTGRSLSYDVLLMPLCAVLVVFLISRTTFGFGLRAAGGNPIAARWSGLDPVRSGVTAILISGGFAGLAGAALLFAGAAPWLSDGFEAGVGFNGIAVALLARNSPIGAVLTAILFSSLNVGSTALQAQLDVPSSLAAVVQGTVVVLMLLCAAFLLRPRPPITAKPARRADAGQPVKAGVTAGEEG